MIIVYAGGRRPVGGQALRSDVPGFFLAFLYLVYVIGWALIDKDCTAFTAEQNTGSGARVGAAARSDLFTKHAGGACQGIDHAVARDGDPESGQWPDLAMGAVQEFLHTLVPALLVGGGILWASGGMSLSISRSWSRPHLEALEQLGAPEQLGTPELQPTASGAGADHKLLCVVRHRLRCPLTDMLVRYYWRMTGERFQVLKL